MKPQVVFATYDSLGNPHYGGGGAIAIHEVASRLTMHYRVIVVTNKYRGAQNCTRDKVKYFYIGTTIHPLIDQLYFHFAALIYSLTHPFDLWVQSLTPPVSLGLLSRLVKQPVIGLVHMLPAADMERKYHLPLSYFERVGLRGYSQMITTSNGVAELIHALSPRTVLHSIPNGVEHYELALRQPTNFVYIGRIEINQKGLDLLIQAYQSTPSLHRYPLMIAGSGQKAEVEKLRALVKDCPQIKYLGSIYGRAKARLLASARAVIVSSRFETFSLVAAEAVAHNIPLVTFDIAGLSWIPPQLRSVAPHLSSSSLSETLVKLSFNYQKASVKAKRAKVVLNPPGWTQVASRYHQVFSEVLNG